MGKLQTPNGPLTHPDIPIISLLLRRFFTLPPSPLVLGHYSFHIHILSDGAKMVVMSANVKLAFCVTMRMDECSQRSWGKLLGPENIWHL